MINIRLATLKDAKGCFELAKTPELEIPGGNSPPLHWLVANIKEKQIFLVAEENGEIIGFRMGERIVADIAIAHLIVIRKDYRRKGVGSLLARAFEEECKKRGLRGVITYVHNDKKTLGFFKKNGYNLGQNVIECNKIWQKVK